MRDRTINFDVNASYPMPNEVARELRRVFPAALNPSSIHHGGQHARALIEEARHHIAKYVGSGAGDRIVFTSGATESNNAALFGALGIGAQRSSAEGGIVASAVEHPSVLEPLAKLSKLGRSVTLVSANKSREFVVDEFVKKCCGATALVSVMLANNETGQILPVAEIARAVRAKQPNILLHTDGVQALGKLSMSFAELGVDMLSLSGHKIGALTGVGALVLKEGVSIDPLLLGGSQELHSRAGTENVLGIVSFGIAAKYLFENLDQHLTHMKRNGDYLRNYLTTHVADISFHITPSKCLPNTLSLHVAGIRGDDLVVALDLEGVYISSGAACASGKPTPSHVLLALGVSEESIRESVRISVPSEYDLSEIEDGARRIVRCIERMRKAGNELRSYA